MPKILFVSKDQDNPTTRYRILPIMEGLQAAGFEAIHRNSELGITGKLSLLKLAVKAHAIVIQRKLYSPIFLFFLRLCCKRIVFDYDDAIFVRSNGSKSTRRLNRFNYVVRIASQVWAGNQYLAKTALALNSQVEVVPTVIDLNKYPKSKIDTNDSSSATIMVWLGSQSTRKYLDLHTDMLEQLGREIPGLSLHIVSDFIFELENLKVINTAWSELAEQTALQQAHIGIAPMTDDAWTQGKCALKVLQYMAASLPVVTSAVGANVDVINPGETGLLAKSNEDWVTAINQLAKDKKRAIQMGLQGRLRVESNYNSETWVKRQVAWLTKPRD